MSNFNKFKRRFSANSRWFGTDVSNEISLGEYGLLIKKISKDRFLIVYVDPYLADNYKEGAGSRTSVIQNLKSLSEYEGFKKYADYTDEQIDAIKEVDYQFVNLLCSIQAYFGPAEMECMF